MPMLKCPAEKYEAFNPPDNPQRQWPSKRLTQAPRWLATDLRDGNQSLACPMTVEQKWKYFHMLTSIGFKEIDVSFPSASQIEYDFTRKLVTTHDAVPADVWLQVLSPCRKNLIYHTVESVRGAKKVILSLYIATSEAFRSAIFGMTKQQVLEMAVDCVCYARSITKDDPSHKGTEWNLLFSPEAFSDTDIDYAIAICDAVRRTWAPSSDLPMVLNLPATVEMSTPNHYADQVELFCAGFAHCPNTVCVSLHPHNDRGCAVAAAELGQMAGATRVEGCLFGNGERTGNVDLVTLALNLWTQGVHPRVDFSNINPIIRVVEECTRIPVHTRAPYGGDAVFQAYSGGHQDAINKAFRLMQTSGSSKWRVPYLAIDPHDLGLTYESVIRLNSQSGKGGVSWTLQRVMDLDLPRGLQAAFSKHVKAESEARSASIPPDEVARLFLERYCALQQDPRVRFANYRQGLHGAHTEKGNRVVEALLSIDGQEWPIQGRGHDILDAVGNALAGIEPRPTFRAYRRELSFENSGTNSMAIVECSLGDPQRGTWGVSIVEDFDAAELRACLASVAEAFEGTLLPKSCPSKFPEVKRPMVCTREIPQIS